LPSRQIYERFLELYVNQPEGRLKFVDHQTFPDTAVKGRRIVEATIIDNGNEIKISGKGNGPIDGFINALYEHVGIPMTVVDYSELSLESGDAASASCYMAEGHAGGRLVGVGINTNIVTASLEAVVSDANRLVG